LKESNWFVLFPTPSKSVILTACDLMLAGFKGTRTEHVLLWSDG
jgi:hypothetical protein